MKAYINLEDMPDGTVAANFVFEGEFDPKSGAHQAANAVRAELDKIMTPAPTPATQLEPMVGVLVEEGGIPVPQLNG